MNKSSILSQDNVSSFLNQSCQSVKKCCEYRQKYQQTYRELSQIRIEYRNMKQQHSVLRSSLKGVQEQSNVLKSILNNKKEMINKLNYQIRGSNQEINRLQDQLNQIQMKYEQLSEDYSKEKSKNTELAEMYRISKDQNRQIMSKLQKSITQYQCLKRNNEKQMRIVSESSQQQIKKAYEAFSIKIQQLNQNITSSSSPLKQSNIMRLHKANQIKNLSPQTSIKTLDYTINTFKQQHHKQQHQYEQALSQKQCEIKQLKGQVDRMRQEMRQSMELFEEQIGQMQNYKQKIRQKQAQNTQLKQSTKEKSEQSQGLLTSIIKRLSNIVKNSLLCSSVELIDKLISFLQSKKINKFQISLILKQLQQSFQQGYKQSLKQSITNQQYQQLSRTLREVNQSYELLMLKHSTLSRQYNEILQDNKRLIKYHHISKYRVERNQANGKKPQKTNNQLDRTPYLNKRMRADENSHNKENIYSTINQ